MGPPVFKTGVGAKAPRRVRFPSASATSTFAAEYEKPRGSESRVWQQSGNTCRTNLLSLSAGGDYQADDSVIVGDGGKEP